MKGKTLFAQNAALLVVDIQEAFKKSIPGLDKIIEKTRIAVSGFELLGLPVLITEQYPKGLGHTVSSIKDATETARYFEKSAFSACGADGFTGYLENNGISAIVVAGIETHVCVNQTVHDLLASGFEVHILEDAVASRSQSDRETALKKIYLSGAVPATVEMALFELLNDSAGPRFKQIQSLIK